MSLFDTEITISISLQFAIISIFFLALIIAAVRYRFAKTVHLRYLLGGLALFTSYSILATSTDLLVELTEFSSITSQLLYYLAYSLVFISIPFLIAGVLPDQYINRNIIHRIWLTSSISVGVLLFLAIGLYSLSWLSALIWGRRLLDLLFNLLPLIVLIAGFVYALFHKKILARQFVFTLFILCISSFLMKSSIRLELFTPAYFHYLSDILLLLISGLVVVTLLYVQQMDLLNSNLKLERSLEDLAVEKNILRALFEKISDGVMTSNAEGKVSFINAQACSIFNFNESEILGKDILKILMLITNWILEKGSLQTESSKLDQDPNYILNLDFTLIYPKRRSLRIAANPVFGRNGKLLGRLVVFRDISKERELEETKSELVQAVMKVFDTPVSNIVMSSDIIANILKDKKGAEHKKLSHFVEIIRSNIQKTSDILSRLSLVTSPATTFSNQAKDYQVVDLTDLLESFTAKQAEEIKSKDLILNLSALPSKALVFSNQKKIISVLKAITDNAVKFSTEGKVIEIQLSEASDEFRISVLDHGLGLSSRDLPSIFDVFFPSTRIHAGGYSLGSELAIGRLTVESLGGSFWARNLEQGAVEISFSLPKTAKLLQMIKTSDPEFSKYLFLVDKSDVVTGIQRCYQYQKCEQSSCPCFNNPQIACFNIASSCCYVNNISNLEEKIRTCLNCPYLNYLYQQISSSENSTRKASDKEEP